MVGWTQGIGLLSIASLLVVPRRNIDVVPLVISMQKHDLIGVPTPCIFFSWYPFCRLFECNSTLTIVLLGPHQSNWACLKTGIRPKASGENKTPISCASGHAENTPWSFNFSGTSHTLPTIRRRSGRRVFGRVGHVASLHGGWVLNSP